MERDTFESTTSPGALINAVVTHATGREKRTASLKMGPSSLPVVTPAELSSPCTSLATIHSCWCPTPAHLQGHVRGVFSPAQWAPPHAASGSLPRCTAPLERGQSMWCSGWRASPSRWEWCPGKGRHIDGQTEFRHSCWALLAHRMNVDDSSLPLAAV